MIRKLQFRLLNRRRKEWNSLTKKYRNDPNLHGIDKLSIEKTTKERATTEQPDVLSGLGA
jgi:hypothetical protein